MIDAARGDEVRVTVIAAGFDRWDEAKDREPAARTATGRDVFAAAPVDEDIDLDADEDFDVPSFLK